MKPVILCLVVVVLCAGEALSLARKDVRFGKMRRAPPPPPVAKVGIRAPVLNWLTQKLDHFAPTDVTTWQQKYYSNDQYYNPDGPLFVFIGGEGPASPGWVSGGQMMDLAQVYGASAFELEHRFYGESRPTVDTTVTSFKYLTTEQALADVASFIQFLRDTTYPTGKLIVFGGSYAGNLAAWAKLRYPHLIDGAVASSAPVLAQVDFPEYFDVVATAMSNSSADCLGDIKQASDDVTAILEGPQGAAAITELFNLCAPLDINNDMDVSTFYSSFSDIYAGAVQYATSVAEVGLWCDMMTNSAYGATPLDRYVNLAKNYLESDGCFETRYEGFIDYVGDTSWNSAASRDGTRAWFYQTCTEYGYYQTSTSSIQPFGDKFQIEYFLQWCPDFYDVAFTSEFVYDAVANTNLFFGGLNPRVENVVFVHGSIDPWHVLGVLEDLSPTVPVIIIEGSAHCADMSSASFSDSASLQSARAQIRNLVGQWLA